ncbi:hypothetical protein GOALK_097_01580 [Gordonia alkanivorans NBRC 16433]|uniref:Uncharacterized protein n=1 Tax=Gordonia alkanivorans NBRC 16433 TaxID=1027371 RepID=F9VZU1_9ACTN|nr:hypothetical protein GOALK_097_01580 [Gordonia alkanivorans NBRC 16433]
MESEEDSGSGSVSSAGGGTAGSPADDPSLWAGGSVNCGRVSFSATGPEGSLVESPGSESGVVPVSVPDAGPLSAESPSPDLVLPDPESPPPEPLPLESLPPELPLSLPPEPLPPESPPLESPPLESPPPESSPELGASTLCDAPPNGLGSAVAGAWPPE